MYTLYYYRITWNKILDRQNITEYNQWYEKYWSKNRKKENKFCIGQAAIGFTEEPGTSQWEKHQLRIALPSTAGIWAKGGYASVTRQKNNRFSATNINSGSRLVKSPFFNDLIVTPINENVHSFLEDNVQG